MSRRLTDCVCGFGKLRCSHIAGRLGHRAIAMPLGKYGIGGSYTDADWVRAIRHGVDPDGKPLVLMLSQEFNKLGDADLG